MRTFYPPIRINTTRRIAVDTPHELYVEESGNSAGIPVLFIHGGPGAGTTPRDRRFFDPEKYRIVLFDQRGCGRSTPHATLQGNNTSKLVEDMEVIRRELKIERWLLFGGSWGSTLSLVYAETYPERVLGLVLRGIFLCRDQDIQWFYQAGANHIFPDYWREYLDPIPETERGDLLHAYYRRLAGDNELERMATAKAWSIWEASCASLHPNPDLVEHFGNPHVALALALIESSYFVNHAFLQDNQIIDNAHHLAEIPGIIIHGRYDIVCPIDQAFALHRAWPKARLEIIRDAGHASSEPGIVDALVQATDEMAIKLREQ